MTSTRYAPPTFGSDHDCWPIHEHDLSGSTRSSHTVSGLAAITSSRSIAIVSVAFATSLLLSFRFSLQRLELCVPESVEERLQLGEPLRARAVEALRAVPSLVHQPRLLEDTEVLGDRRPRHVEARRDLARRELTLTDELEDLSPPRLRNRPQCSFHCVLCKHRLTLVSTYVSTSRRPSRTAARTAHDQAARPA